MKQLLLSLLIIGGYTNGWAQESSLPFYKWAANPKLHQISDSAAKESQYVILDKFQSDFTYDEQGNLTELYLHHKITRVNSDDAIDRNNKVYLPLEGVYDVKSEKARVIKPDGSVIELDEGDIKEAKDEEDEKGYRYFALEGIEKGSEVEYYFVYIRSPRYVGNTRFLQGEYPIGEVSFVLTAPSNLIFAFKSKNGFPEMELDTNETERLYWSAQAFDIPKLKSERFASYQANLMQVSYKLNRNLVSSRKPLFTYASAAQIFVERVYQENSKRELKDLGKLAKRMNLKMARNEEDKIRMMEDYIKENFVLVNGSVSKLQSIEAVLDNNAGDDMGMLKVFCNLMDLEGIDHQIMMTSNRFEIPLDPEFEAFHYLEDYYIYFPQYDKYLQPISISDRYGSLGYSNSHNYGVFIDRVKVGDFTSGVSSVEWIDALPADFTQNNLSLDVSFLSNFEALEIDLISEQTGYAARNYQPIYRYLDEDDQEEITEELLKYYSEDAEFKKKEVKYSEPKDFLKHPFTLKAKFTSRKFIEKAGPNYLFKVGDLIGEQSELYGKDERNLPVENAYNREYNRKITFTIPDGYRIANISDLEMDVFHESEEERTCAFTSSFEQKGNKVTVDIYEFYDQIYYPVEEYPAYRAVINAAADYNKITLLLEPVR